MELEGYNLQFKKRTAHQSLVDAIIEICGEHPRYDYKFWLGRISRSKLSPDEILNLVDKTKDMELKYRGGYINKRL